MSQENEILEYLMTGKTLTPIEALQRFRTFRLAARIANLRKEGFHIETELYGDKKKYARYRYIGYSGADKYKTQNELIKWAS